jgi:hypothetical protein
MDREIKIKAALYGIPLFLAPFADKVGAILFQDKYPSIPMTIGCTLLGVISACIGLRAYTDGSYERSRPNGNGQSVAPLAKPLQ